ncbi:hypothetical protein Q9189_004761 [Teloschistes chrysophthalmus]
MGVIKRKNIVKGNEGGLKYICDVCSADITSTVSELYPFQPDAPKLPQAEHFILTEMLIVYRFEYDALNLPVPNMTFAYPASRKEIHHVIMTPGRIPFRSLNNIRFRSDHVGGFRNKEEVREHYIETYIESSRFPLPENASPQDLSLVEEIPRETFQACKKRRIEKRKEDAKSAPPATPKQKPTASVPACHEVQGYMPGRLEFETEFCNEAEEAVQHMQFDPGDGINSRTGELEPEMELKMLVMNIYNARLTARADRKKVIFEHKLLEYRTNANKDKKRTKEERDLHNKAKPFARMMNHIDLDSVTVNLEYEHNLRQAISQLQDWRQMRIGDLKSGEKYEQEKQIRSQRPAPTGAFDRIGGVRISKPTPPVETPSATTALTAPELPERLKPSITPNTNPSVAQAPTSSTSNPHDVTCTPTKGPLTNGNANVSGTPSSQLKHKYSVPSLNGTTPLKLSNENTTDLHLLTKEEADLCSALRLMPKPYLVIKEGLIREAMKSGGGLKRRLAKEVCKVRLSGACSLKLGPAILHVGHIGW